MGTQTMTEAPPQPTIWKPFLLSLQTKNATALKIKTLATGAHFLSLVAAGVVYFAGGDHTRHCFIFSAVAWVLAMFIPPTGMIGEADVPAYAKKSMLYIPNRANPTAEGQFDHSQGRWATKEAKEAKEAKSKKAGKRAAKKKN